MYGLPEELANLVQPRSIACIGYIVVLVMDEWAVAFSVHTLQELTFLAK